MNRTALRVLTGIAALAIAAVSPAALGSALADDRPLDTRTWGLTSAQAENVPLVTAIASARDDFRVASIAARTAWRTTMQGIRAEVLADAASERASTAGDYRAALERAWARHGDQVDTATAAARSTLLTARSIYTSAVTAAFTTYAPGAAVPRGVLEPGWWGTVTDGLWTSRDAERPRS